MQPLPGSRRYVNGKTPRKSDAYAIFFASPDTCFSGFDTISATGWQSIGANLAKRTAR